MEGNRCVYCEKINYCPHCGAQIDYMKHVGVRATSAHTSSIWHIAHPCGHFVDLKADLGKPEKIAGKLAVYNGGPVWKAGYQWVNIYWGTWWQGQQWVSMLDNATQDIEDNQSYSGELNQYGVGIGSFKEHVIINADPPNSVSNTDIGASIAQWIKESKIPDLGSKGAYNVFLPPRIIATLGGQKSCSVFCDYHDTANGNSGPFFTCEPYPCSTGCNQCDNNPFDTLTQGLSEEMVELKTDMNPGTGWVIGNEEICDYCDKTFVCNKISTGEYVNAWYSDKSGSCWKP